MCSPARSARATRAITLGCIAASVLLPLSGPAVAAPEALPSECAGLDPGGAPARVDAIDFAEVQRRVLRRSSELAAICEQLEARRARLEQAQRRPNPELAMEFEEFAGSGDFAGFEAWEATLIASQRVETSGKRARRGELARAELERARRGYGVARANALARAERAFVGLLAAQRRVALLEDLVAAARASAAASQRLVAAGAVSPVETTRAAVERAIAEVELEAARRALQAARVDLAASWGDASADFARARGELRTESVASADALRERLARSPRLAELDAELARREARVDLEDARAVPDVTLAAGVRRFEESDDVAFVAELRMPIGVFDRNRGERAAARAELRGARHERSAAAASLAAELARALAQLEASAEEARQLRERILPAAAEAFTEVQRGYAQGRLRSLDVIDAQRRLFELRLREVDALVGCAEARAEIRRLTGLSAGSGAEEERR